MNFADTPMGLAEVSLALAGFAAIVLVLGTRGNPLDAEALANVRVMISNAVACALGCLIGVALLALEISAPFVWVLFSAIALAGTAGGSALNYISFLRHLEGRGFLTGRAVFWWSFVVAASTIQLANALSIFGPPSFGRFFFGVVLLLSLAGLQFLYLVYVILGRSSA